MANRPCRPVPVGDARADSIQDFGGDNLETDSGKPLLQRIGERFEEFSPKQRILAKYVLDNYIDLAYATVAQLAHCAHVSETTVVRFVYCLGFESFADFMSELRDEIERAKATRAASLNRYTFDQGSYEFPGDIMQAIFALEISVMEETLAKIPTDLFEKAVDKIMSASMLLIVGCKANKCQTQAAFFAFDVLRPHVRVIEEFNLSTKGLWESVPKNAACVIFSTPRYPRETQAILEGMKNCPVKPYVIGITDSVSSPIAQYSDLVLQIPEKFVTFIDTNAAYMSLIHAIAFGMYLKNPDYSKKRVEEYDSFARKYNFYVRDNLELIDF